MFTDKFSVGNLGYLNAVIYILSITFPMYIDVRQQEQCVVDRYCMILYKLA